MDTQLTVRLPTDLSGKIRKKAQAMRLKRADIVRLALIEFLEDRTGETSPYDRVRHLLGSAKTGVSDLGERHREHLLEKIRRG